MYLDKKSPVPIYYQLKNMLLKRIQDGDLAAGSLIPSERDLGETYRISRMTVRQALNQLTAEGVLYREKGRGTFVSRLKIEQRNIMSFSDMIKLKGLVPVTKVLDFTKRKADAGMMEILGLEADEPLYAVKRLRLAGDIPVGIEEEFMPEKYFPSLEKYDMTASLYKLIDKEYGYAISYIDNTIEAAKPAAYEKEMLKISSGAQILKINGIYYDKSDMKLFYEKSVYRSDEYKYSVRVYVNKSIE
jgi:GntR family transcriptional regulator